MYTVIELSHAPPPPAETSFTLILGLNNRLHPTRIPLLISLTLLSLHNLEFLYTREEEGANNAAYSGEGV